MATCGPSNPLQNLKDFAQRDASLHHELPGQQKQQPAGFRSNVGHSGAAQFTAFSNANQSEFVRDMQGMNFDPQFSCPHSDFSYQNPSLRGTSPAAAQFARARPGYASPALTAHTAPQTAQAAAQASAQIGTQSQNWQAQFERLQVSGPLQTSQPMMYQQMGYVGQMLSYRRQIAPQMTSQMPTYEPQISDDAFNAAFAEAEKSLQQMQSKTEHTQHEEAPKLTELRSNAEDASTVAEQIIHAAHANANPDLSEKLQQSKFMNLMAKLKSSEVRVGEHDFVNSESAKVEPMELAQEDLSHVTRDQNELEVDWPPQRPLQTSSLRPEVCQTAPTEYTNAEPINSKESSSSSHRQKEAWERFSVQLDDPETYFLKMQKNLEPKEFEQNFPTALDAAKDLGNMNTPQQWEEDYDNW